MRKFLVLVLLAVSTSVSANGFRGHYSRGFYGYHWVAPVVVGGAVVYALTPRVVVQYPPVQYYPVPPLTQPMFREEYRWNEYCRCYDKVFVQIQ